MEPDFTAQDAVASLRKVLPWIALSPTFSSVTSVEDLLNTSGPAEASKFLTTLDSSPEVTTAPTWPEIFSALAQKIRSSCGREPPASWLSSETQNEAIRWLKFFQLALVHAVYCEDRVNNIETIRSELPDSAQRELMNQISGVQQEFFPQEADNLSTNPSPISFASLLGDSEQDLSILNNNNIVRTKKESFYRELERLRDQLSNLEAEKADLVEKTRELRGKLTDSEERALKLEYTVEEQTEKSEQLRAEVKSAVEAKTELTLETRALKDEMDILRERACRGEAAQAANLVFKERIARMEAEIAKREEQRKKLVPVTEAEKTMAILTESVAVAREEGEAYRRRASLAEDEVLRLRRKIDRLEAEKADWEREREAFVEQVRALKLRESEKSVEGAEGRVLLAEIEDFADDYEELKEPEEEPNRTYGEDDGFCDYDLNTSESSGGAAASGGNDSDYETCGDATPKDGGSGYDHPGVVATEEEAPRCVTVHHVKAEVYAPPATIEEIETKKLLLIPSSKFDIDPRETSLGSPLRVPKRPKRHGTPPKSSSAVRSAISAPGPFWNRRKGPKPGSESSLSSEPSVHYQDIKFTDEVKEQEEVDGIVDEASLLVASAQDAPDFDDDFYGNSRVSRRCRHEAEMMAKIQAKQPIKDRAKSKGRSKSRSKAVSEVILDVIGMCGP